MQREKLIGRIKSESEILGLIANQMMLPLLFIAPVSLGPVKAEYVFASNVNYGRPNQAINLDCGHEGGKHAQA
jgi:hypothetical protein